MSRLSGLFCTHRFFGWTGSELVLVELAESFAAAGGQVTLFCPFAEQKVVEEALGKDVRLLSDPREVRLEEFDLVYTQHQMTSRFLHLQSDEAVFGKSRPFFVYNHLSPFSEYAFPGPWCEADTADFIWSNSDETSGKLARRAYLLPSADVVPNPAPRAFDGKPKPYGPLKRLLSVSNHLPEELIAAFALLTKQGIDITRVGKPDHQRRLTSADIVEHDAVVTIGKTVQYALRGRRPVFCYDGFAGPGWLNAENFDAARKMNFSGRSHARARTPDALVQEVISGFPQAHAFCNALEEMQIEPFRLENYAEALYDKVREHRANPSPLRGLLVADRETLRARWAHEAELYQLVDKQMGQILDQMRRHGEAGRKLRARIQEQQKRIEHQKNRINKLTSLQKFRKESP